jgi:hypothetical protein
LKKFLNAIFNSSYHNINIVIKIKNSNIVKYKCSVFLCISLSFLSNFSINMVYFINILTYFMKKLKGSCNATFKNISVILWWSVIGEGNRSKTLTCCKSLTNIGFPSLYLNIGSNNIHVAKKLLKLTINLNKYIDVPQNWASQIVSLSAIIW